MTMISVTRIPPQPSDIDLALCITIIRSQPPSLTAMEYIQQLQSLAVPGTHAQGEEPLIYTQVMDVRDIIDGRNWRKLLDKANEKIVELRMKISNIERERDVLQANIKGLRKAIAHGDVQCAVEVERESGGTELDHAQNPSNRPLHSTLSLFNKPQVSSLLYLQDLAPWTECAPRILDSLKFLQRATAPKAISVAIQQTCRMLTDMTQSLCKGINVDLGEESGLMQLDKDFCLVSQIHGSRVTKSLPLVLLNSINEVLAALEKLYPPQMPYQKINGKLHRESTYDEDTASASNAIMISLASILSFIHVNTITILQHLTKQANSPMAHSNGLPSTSNSSTSAPPYVPTGQGTSLYSASSRSHMVPDLRKGITSFFVQLIRSLRGDIQQHRDLIEAMTFRLMTLFGSQIVTFNIASNHRNLRETAPKGRKNRGQHTSGMSRANVICEEESLYIQDLAAEEASWFWLEILDVVWEKYLGNLEYINKSSDGRSLQGCGGALSEAGDTSAPQFTQIAPRKSMVTEAKRKLKEALLQAVLGPGIPTGEKEPGRNMRLTTVPVLNEIWHTIGWDEQV
ncbi:hypothetical protein EV426DRAFT_610712 [Tirmania nivea]|nr:hypothetical protein EV426DRAFT_610712 [Tirmania nivea]